MHDQDERSGSDLRNRREVLYGIEAQLRDRVRSDGQPAARMREQCVAVGNGTRNDFSADRAGGAGPIVDDDRLAQIFGERRLERAHGEIGATAGWIGNDYADRLY